jgi:hypothetical protein
MDEVNIDLDVAVLNWIGGHVDGRHIVTIDKCGRAKWSVKFLK